MVEERIIVEGNLVIPGADGSRFLCRYGLLPEIKCQELSCKVVYLHSVCFSSTERTGHRPMFVVIRVYNFGPIENATLVKLVATRDKDRG